MSTYLHPEIVDLPVPVPAPYMVRRVANLPPAGTPVEVTRGATIIYGIIGRPLSGPYVPVVVPVNAYAMPDFLIEASAGWSIRILAGHWHDWLVKFDLEQEWIDSIDREITRWNDERTKLGY